ncbi:MAG: hypothetical protein MUQ32_06985 [Chloroflexi bacterium]|nr:hypothetical protein [Chloroflexota bacterium]
MIRIGRFGIVKTATVAAAMYAVMTLIVSLVILLPLAIIGVSMAPDGGFAGFGVGVAGVLLFGLFGAAIYAVIGWIVTAIACAIYNLAAGWVGGIEMQVEAPGPAGPSGGYPAYGAPGGYGAPGQYGAPGGYGAPGQYGAPPTSFGPPGSVPPPPGAPG